MTLTAASPVNIDSSHFISSGKMLSTGLKMRGELLWALFFGVEFTTMRYGPCRKMDRLPLLATFGRFSDFN